MWLYVTRSNNQPNNVAAYFLDAVGEYCGCPVDLVTDLVTEYGIIAAIQSFPAMTQIAIDMCHHLETNLDVILFDNLRA